MVGGGMLRCSKEVVGQPLLGELDDRNAVKNLFESDRDPLKIKRRTTNCTMSCSTVKSFSAY